MNSIMWNPFKNRTYFKKWKRINSISCFAGGDDKCTGDHASGLRTVSNQESRGLG